MRKVAWLLAFGALLTTPGRARANPEPSAYDTRSVGAGLTGVAHLERPAAVAINPANLAGIEEWALTLNSILLFIKQMAPVSGEDTRILAPTAVGPLISVFGAGRISDRLVVGGGVYIQAGYGNGFEDVGFLYGTALDPPEDIDVSFFTGEAAFSVGVDVIRGLRLGLSFRIPYAQQSAVLFQENPANGELLRVDQDVSGFGIPGIRFGINYRPIDDLSFGLLYRSKNRIPMSGTTTIPELAAAIEVFEGIPTEAEWVNPHMLHFGVAGWLLERSLMMTAEYRIQLHRSANEVQKVELDLPDTFLSVIGGSRTIEAPLEWENAHSVRLGTEYRINAWAMVRLGYNVGVSASTVEGAQFFTPPPGVNHAVFGGATFTVDRFEIDVALAHSYGETTIEPRADLCQPGDQVRVGCPGFYSVETFWGAVSLTYDR